MMKRKVLLSLAQVLTMAAPGFCHGAPEHGGAFTEVKEYTFELVSKRGSGDTVDLSMYIKDPQLKPVTTGNVTIEVSSGARVLATLELRAAGNQSFAGQLSVPEPGKYKVTTVFTPQPDKAIRARHTIRL